MIFLIRANGNSCTRKSFWGQQIDAVKYRIKLKLRLFPFFLYYLSVCMSVTYHSQVPDLLHDTRPEGLQCLLGIAARGSKTISRHLLICSKRRRERRWDGYKKMIDHYKAKNKRYGDSETDQECNTIAKQGLTAQSSSCVSEPHILSKSIIIIQWNWK